MTISKFTFQRLEYRRIRRFVSYISPLRVRETRRQYANDGERYFNDVCTELDNKLFTIYNVQCIVHIYPLPPRHSAVTFETD